MQLMLGNTLFTAGAPGQHVHGFTLMNVLSWLGNADVRLSLLEQLPARFRATLVERSLSSDTVEAVFGMIMMLCGFKPSQRTITGAARRLDFSARMQQTADRGFGLRPRRRGKQIYAERAQQQAGKAAAWNNGLKLQEPSLKRKRALAISKRAVAAARGKTGSIRQTQHNRVRLVTSCA